MNPTGKRLAAQLAFASAYFILAAHFAAAYGKGSPPRTVSHVDLESYMGVWYEIASIPKPYEKGCVAAQATYELLDDGTVSVVNSCRLNDFDGELREMTGIAKVVDQGSNAKLSVDFGFGDPGEYWILDLGRDYEYAIVGNSTRSSAWILSRTRHIDLGKLRVILEHLELDLGYDLSELRLMPQPVGKE